MNLNSSLTEKEVRILVALALQDLNGYALARQCEDDAAGEVSMSNGTLYPALKRLSESGAVEKRWGQKAAERNIWHITRQGRLVLQWQLGTYRRLVRLGDERI